MRTLYFDCFSGAAGDMILGALIDAGVPFEDVRAALGTLAVDRDTIWTERVVRAGVAATKFQVRGEAGGHAHAHGHGHDDRTHAHDGGHHHDGHVHTHPHDHPHDGAAGARGADPARTAGATHAHRTLGEINRLIDGSALSGAGKDRAKALFHRLGTVEAGIHGTTLDDVHLHEVGAIDSIVDIVGSVYAIESLGVDRIEASPLNVGSGTVRAAHGLYPVPAPATLALLRDIPIYAGPQPGELVTPTGALLISAYAERIGALPALRVHAVGYGAGARDFADTPNVLRVLIGEGAGPSTVDTVAVIEAEIDDMNPQIFGTLMDGLLAAGALDVYYTAIQMKKGRPGVLVTILAPPPARERLIGLMFRETSTIGVRHREMARECLDREVVEVAVGVDRIRIKVARRGDGIVNVAPEFDDCVHAATSQSRPVKEIQALALSAFYTSTHRSA